MEEIKENEDYQKEKFIKNYTSKEKNRKTRKKIQTVYMEKLEVIESL